MTAFPTGYSDLTTVTTALKLLGDDGVAPGNVPLALLRTASGQAAISGETGVLDTAYAVGDVRRYGVFPDQKYQSSDAAAPFYSVPLTGQYVNWETAFTSRITAIYTNAVHADIRILWPRGYYGTSLNFADTASSGTRMHSDGAEFGGVLHLVTVGGGFLTNVTLTGEWTTYDRFGTINLQNAYIERIRIKSDTTKSTSSARGRGVHLYGTSTDILIGEIIIDDCSDQNGDGALAIDDQTSARIRINKVTIKDSDVHGAFIEGRDHSIGELTVNGFGAGRSSQTSSDYGGSINNHELCAVLLNRCPGLTIGTVRTSQKTPTVAVTVTTTNASPTLTNVNTYDLAVNMPITGTGIPANTVISAIPTSTTLTLSANATASATVTATVSREVRNNCVTTNASTTVTGAGFSTLRVGQIVAGTGVAASNIAVVVTTSGSHSITTTSGLSALRVGQRVTGTGIPNGAFIQVVVSDTAATLSNKATATGTITMTASCVIAAIASDTSMTLSTAATASGTAALTFTRSNALYCGKIGETDVGAGPGVARIDTWIAANVERRGFSVGDRNQAPANPSGGVANTALNIRALSFENKATTQNDTGWPVFHMEAPVTGTTKVFGNEIIRIASNYGSDCVSIPATGDVDLGLLDCTALTGNASLVFGSTLSFTGGGAIREIRDTASGASGSSATRCTIGSNNPRPIKIGAVTLTAATITSVTALDLTSLLDAEIGPISTTLFRNTPNIMINLAQRCLIKLGKLSETSNAGWGIRFQNNTDVRIDGGNITGFLIGVTGSAAGNTRCSAINLVSTSNTTNSDLASGQLTLKGTSSGVVPTIALATVLGRGSTAAYVSGNLASTQAVAAVANAAGQTLTAAQMRGGYINRTLQGNVTDTTDTAAAIVASIPGAEVGASYMLVIINAGTITTTLTLAGGTGVTLAGTTTVVNGQTRTYLVRVTNATVGSEAVTIQGLMAAAS